MAPNNWLEIPVFIHGITPDENPGSHESQYTILFKNIQSELDKLNKPKFTTDPIEIEWGWRDPGSKSNAKDDQYLAEVEQLDSQWLIQLSLLTKEIYYENRACFVRRRLSGYGFPSRGNYPPG